MWALGSRLLEKRRTNLKQSWCCSAAPDVSPAQVAPKAVFGGGNPQSADVKARERKKKVELAKGAKKTPKKTKTEKNKYKFKGHALLFPTVLHCTQAETVAADGSGVTNALIVHYIWRIQRFETQKGWGVGIQSIR